MNYTDFIGKELPEKNFTIELEADAFYENAFFLIKKIEKVINENGTSTDAIVFIPAVVNLAFSCELYLKSLLGRKEIKHQLKELFNLQTDVIQNFIKKELITNIPSIKSDSDFYNRLDNISETFYRWRYFYEPGMVTGMLDIEFLKIFAFALKNIKVLYK